MSIYCTNFSVGDEHSPRCKRMVKVSKGVYQQDNSRPCSCKHSPIKYQHSNVLPSNRDERGGILMLGAIPNHITRDGRDNRPENGNLHPWLRVSFFECRDSLILTRPQVEKMRDALNNWLERT